MNYQEMTEYAIIMGLMLSCYKLDQLNKAVQEHNKGYSIDLGPIFQEAIIEND